MEQRVSDDGLEIFIFALEAMLEYATQKKTVEMPITGLLALGLDLRGSKEQLKFFRAEIKRLEAIVESAQASHAAKVPKMEGM